VMKFTNATFIDQYIHFGGDEVTYACWDAEPSIVKYMKDNNIASSYDLSVVYRLQQKKLFRTFSNKKVIYWANEDIDLPLEAEDTIHWWGVAANVNKMAGRPNDVILSNYDLTYLDVGTGGRYGDPYQVYIHWRKLYSY